MLSLQVVQNPVQAGDTAEVVINLGTQNLQVNDIYGLAFAVTYDTTLIVPGSVMASFNSNWMGPLNSELITLYQDMPSANRIEFGMTRINHINRSGDGEIGRLTLITIDNIAGKTNTLQDFEMPMHIVEVLAISHDETVIPLSLLGDTLIIEDVEVIQDTTSAGLVPESHFRIYPNPSSGKFFIECENELIISYTLHNYVGQELLKKESLETNSLILELSEFDRGIYLLEVETAKGIETKKIVIK